VVPNIIGSGTDLISLLILLFLMARLLQKSTRLRRFKSDRARREIRHNIVLQVINAHRLTESDLGYDVKLSSWRP